MYQLTREDKLNLLGLARDGEYNPAKHRAVAELFTTNADRDDIDASRLTETEHQILISLIIKIQGNSPGHPYIEMLEAANAAGEKVLADKNWQITYGHYKL